ncbi:DNA adenine methylase [Parabacteroides sp. AM08-6]|nr:DNA adenine methylase [Parabacteroides sp. AM08-6]
MANLAANFNHLKPLLKWAGGKEKEIKYIVPCLPDTFTNYFEPFVGGGSVYMSLNAEHYFINDKSDELISLYQNIAQENPDFYKYVDAIIDAWDNMTDYFLAHKHLGETYKCYRSDTIAQEELKETINWYVKKEDGSIKGIIPSDILFDKQVLINEFKKNLVRKLLRMKVIEEQKNKLPDEDLYNNIETAFKSALYMYFRYLYNREDIKEKYPELHSALFLFIRNYSYSGMFRYNDKGEFNVPYGGIGYNGKTLKKKKEYYQSKPLLDHLQDTTIENLDFETFLTRHNPTENDFIFLDPPYDSEFSTYSQNSFTEREQRRLANYLYNCQAKWMMVIKNTPLISSLYFDRGLNIQAFDKKYLVSFMNRNDKNAEHLIIMNY